MLACKILCKNRCNVRRKFKLILTFFSKLMLTNPSLTAFCFVFACKPTIFLVICTGFLLARHEKTEFTIMKTIQDYLNAHPGNTMHRKRNTTYARKP